MKFTDEHKEMVARLIRGSEHDLEEFRNGKYGHHQILSDLKDSSREKLDWLEAFQKRMEQEPNADTVNSRLLGEDTYKALIRLGVLETSVRSYNIGSSDYSRHIIQPWTIWQDYKSKSVGR